MLNASHLEWHIHFSLVNCSGTEGCSLAKGTKELFNWCNKQASKIISSLCLSLGFHAFNKAPLHPHQLRSTASLKWSVTSLELMVIRAHYVSLITRYQLWPLPATSCALCVVCGVVARETAQDMTAQFLFLWLCCVVTFVMVSNNQIGTFSRCIVVM